MNQVWATLAGILLSIFITNTIMAIVARGMKRRQETRDAESHRIHIEILSVKLKEAALDQERSATLLEIDKLNLEQTRRKMPVGFGGQG